MNAIDSPAWATSQVVQWLRLHASHERAMCTIPGRGTKIPYAMGFGIYIYIKTALPEIFPVGHSSIPPADSVASTPAIGRIF